MRAARVVRHVRRVSLDLARLAAFAFGALLALGVVSSSSSAGALEGSAGPIAVSVTLQDGGRSVTMKADAPGNVQIFEIAAHLCKHGANVRNSYDFGYQGNFCTNEPVGGGDVEKVASFANGVASATLRSFNVAPGSTQWVNELGYPFDIACGPGQPCDVVFRLQITDATVFFTAPVCFGADCPVDAPPAPSTTVAAAAAGPSAPAPSTPTPTVKAGTPVANATTATVAPTGAHTSDAALDDTSSGSPDTSELATGLPSSFPTTDETARALRMGAAMVASAVGGARILSVRARLRRQRISPGMA